MKKSELLKWINEIKTTSDDPEIEFWLSETEPVNLLSIYTDEQNSKIYIDVQFE